MNKDEYFREIIVDKRIVNDVATDERWQPTLHLSDSDFDNDTNKTNALSTQIDPNDTVNSFDSVLSLAVCETEQKAANASTSNIRPLPANKARKLLPVENTKNLTETATDACVATSLNMPLGFHLRTTTEATPALPALENDSSTLLEPTNQSKNILPQMKQTCMHGNSSFEVESILDKRITNDCRTYYLIKWRGYPNTKNSWVPGDQLICFELLAHFERKRAEEEMRSSLKAKQKRTLKCQTTKANLDANVKTSKISRNIKEQLFDCEERPTSPIFGWERNLEVQNIVGVFKFDGEIFYTVNWQGLEVLDVVTADSISNRCPEKVIEFLEKRIVLKT